MQLVRYGQGFLKDAKSLLVHLCLQFPKLKSSCSLSLWALELCSSAKTLQNFLEQNVARPGPWIAHLIQQDELGSLSSGEASDPLECSPGQHE